MRIGTSLKFKVACSSPNIYFTCIRFDGYVYRADGIFSQWLRSNATIVTSCRLEKYPEHLFVS